MGKRKNREKNRDRRIVEGATDNEGLTYQNHVVKESPLEKFKPTPKQEYMLDTVANNVITFVEAPAGTGKSSTALYYACQRYLKEGKAGGYKIYVVRSEEQVGAGLGHLKGELEDKLEPVFAPAADILNKFLGRGVVSTGVKNGNIHYKTPTFMLGCTIDAPAFVLIDEAQQITPQLMNLLLTRLGAGDITVVVAGDRMQKYTHKACGLTDAINRFTRVTDCGRIGVDQDIGYFEFDEEDIMRHGVVKTIIKGYRKDI